MSIARRFTTALAEENPPALASPELLPVRLAKACARVLPVDGVGLSLMCPDEHRVPLGGSSATAAAAETLQFTAGEGPCIEAQRSRQPVFAVEEDLRRRWPAFAELFLGRTPYRAVVALPLQLPVGAEGAIDLFFEDPAWVPQLKVFEAVAVGELVASTLSDAAVWSDWAPERGPDWMHGPAPQRRAAVWEATGTLVLELGVDTTEALDLVRARAYRDGVSADEVAADLLSGRLTAADLRHCPA